MSTQKSLSDFHINIYEYIERNRDEAVSHAHDLCNITESVKIILREIKADDQPWFGISPPSNLVTVECLRKSKYLTVIHLFSILSELREMMRLWLPRSWLSIETQLFLKHFKKVDMDIAHSVQDRAQLSRQQAERVSSTLNSAIDGIRIDMKSKNFPDLFRMLSPAIYKNYLSGEKYIDSLFDKYSRLLVLRIDFGYHKSDTLNGRYFENLTADKLRMDRETLVEFFQTDAREHGLVGYMWKIEWKPDKGFHIHTLLFMDGSKVQREYKLGNIFGKHWGSQITDNQGYIWNCNLNKEVYDENLGIGMINADNKKKIQNLKLRVLSYITKPDYLARIILGTDSRLFGRSCGNLIPSRLGRPRKRIHPTAKV